MRQHLTKLNHYFWSFATSIGGILIIAFLIRTFGYGLYQVPTGSMETTMLVGERFFADKFTVRFGNLKHGDIISFDDPKYQYSSNPVRNVFQHYVLGPVNWTKRLIGLPGDEIKGVIEDGHPVVYRKNKGTTEFVKLDEPYLNRYPLIHYFEIKEIPFSFGLQIPIISDVIAGVVGLFKKPQTYPDFPLKSYDPQQPYDAQPFYNLDPARVQIARHWAQMRGEDTMKIPGTPCIEKVRAADGTVVKEINHDIFHEVLGENEYWGMGDNRLGSYDSRFFGKIPGSFIHGKIVYRIFSIDSDSSWWIVDLIKHPIDFWTKMVRWNRCLQRLK
ncbi:MAG TPA: signal peptidase I [Candidatus Babeliales bacterium]|nr:signal peptidase I [Candidatus Babeliales bacterium]